MIKVKTFYVYILSCSDDSYYTDMTNNLEQRIIQHQLGNNPDTYTFSRRPVLLKWYVECNDPNDAIRIEKQIKGWTKRKKTAIINGQWDDLVTFSKNYTEHGNDKSSTG
ncbi:putative endonuclease [Flavobacteriaceae bacterium MAR_2010_188]|nr:putative endonuclease [Flavobacteriaceae bacterium MAR_2010_188]